jgi:hypothetical protein
MRILLLLLALAVASSAAVKHTETHPVKQKIVKPKVPKNRKSNIKPRKAPKVKARKY